MQACFLGDVGVILCNSLGDNHFQTYVMNNVEIVIDYYLLITSHVYHAFTSHTLHKLFFAKLSTWNYVWIWFGHPRLCFLWCLMQNIVKGWQKLCFWWLKSLFWSSRLKSHVFEKHLNSFSCISFIKLIGLSCFSIIFYSFSKNSNFQNLDRSNVFFDWLKISWFLIIALCLTQLVFDQYSTVWNWKIFSF